MLHKLDQWLIWLLLAIASSPIPLFSQDPREKYQEIPAEVYDFDGACHYLVELGDKELMAISSKNYRYNPFLAESRQGFCILPDVPPSLPSANLTIHNISGLKKISDRYEKREIYEGSIFSNESFCFKIDTKAKKEVNLSFFWHCRVKKFSFVTYPNRQKSIYIKPTTGQSLNLGGYLSSQLIFPEIIADGDVVNFSVLPSSIIPALGEWRLGDLKIYKIDSRGTSPAEFPVFEFSSEILKKSRLLTYKIGDVELLVPLPEFKMISPQDRLIERACSGPPSSVSEGDIVCVANDAGRSEVRFENKDNSIRLTPVAQSSKTSYFSIPHSNFSSILTVWSNVGLIDKTEIHGEGGSGVHYCGCKTQRELTSGPGSALTAVEIKRLQTVVVSALSDAEAVWDAEQKNLKMTPNGMYSKEAVITIAAKGATAVFDRLTGTPILMGLRSYADDVIKEKIEQFVEATTEYSGISTDNRLFVVVAVRNQEEDRPELVSKEVVDSFFKKLSEFMRFLRTANEHPIISLDIQTTPTGALFSMHPKSYDALKYETGTNGKMVSIWIGRYIFDIKRRDFEDVEDGSELDLVGDRRPILKCKLSPKGGENSLCVRSE